MSQLFERKNGILVSDNEKGAGAYIHCNPEKLTMRLELRLPKVNREFARLLLDTMDTFIHGAKIKEIFVPCTHCTNGRIEREAFLQVTKFNLKYLEEVAAKVRIG